MQYTDDEDTFKLPAIAVAATQPQVAGEQKRLTWIFACKEVAASFTTTRLGFLFLTYLAPLFLLKNFSTNVLPLSTLLHSWNRWDTNQYTFIATYGYAQSYRTAFFPLFPLLENILAFLVRDPFIAGLFISNVAALALFIVMYKLLAEDFTAELARFSVFALAIFPTAFFFASAYNESLFLFFTLLSFYQMRRKRWWLAGLAGLGATLTRSSGLCLLVPFAYEYLRQHQFQLRRIRLDILGMLGIPAGTGLFAVYCSIRFHDPLAFEHAQAVWGHSLHGPWSIFLEGFKLVIVSGPISFPSIHNALDLGLGLFVLLLVIAGLVGPWKFSREHLGYGIFALVFYLFDTLFPLKGGFPLASFSRYMLEIFPAFLTLAMIGRDKKGIQLAYTTISPLLLATLLLLWLTGGWMV